MTTTTKSRRARPGEARACANHPLKRATSRGLCHACYCAAWRAGTIHLHNPIGTPPNAVRKWIEDYFARFDAGEFADDCILWPFSVNNYGYPQLWKDGRNVLAIREIWERLSGQRLAPDEVMRHSCDVRRCVNIQHLSSGTIADNNRDRDERNRQARGERHGRAKLTARDVREIRQLVAEHGRSGNLSFIARGYGVHLSVVQDLVDGVTWRDVN